jgi:hypothetical protein
MDSKPDRSLFLQITSGAACYILWFVTAALGIGDILLARNLLLEIAIALHVNPWTHGAIDKFGLIILGIGWLILTWVVEAYYRKAAGENIRKLLRYFAVVSLSQIIFGGLAVFVTFLLT